VNDIFISLGIALSIVDIPSKEFKQWIDELAPYLGFVVPTGPIDLMITIKPLNQFHDILGSAHGFPTSAPSPAFSMSISLASFEWFCSGPSIW
jgi:hypothetical protein